MILLENLWIQNNLLKYYFQENRKTKMKAENDEAIFEF